MAYYELKGKRVNMSSNSKKKTALILEGGGCKGAFEAGIISYIAEKKIQVDLVGGTSVGGLNAACFAFNKTTELLELWENIGNGQVYAPPQFLELITAVEGKLGPNALKDIDKIARTVIDLLQGGFFSKIGSFLKLFGMRKQLSQYFNLPLAQKNTVKAVIQNIFSKSCLLDNSPLQQTCQGLFGNKKVSEAQTRFYLTAFQLQSASLVYFGPDHNAGDVDAPVVDALMATSAIQGAFPVKMIQGKQYIDGGNGANLPLSYAVKHQCNRIILARDNTEGDTATQLFNKIWEVVFRAYITSFGNLTIRDVKWANDISRRIATQQNDFETLKKFGMEIQDASLQAKYQQTLSHLKPVFSNEIPIEIIEIIPEWTPPNIIDFNVETSKRLIQDGYEKAAKALSGI